MSEILRGLKEIGNYIKVSAETAKNYAKGFNLPIIRLPNGRYYAKPKELDRWLDRYGKRKNKT